MHIPLTLLLGLTATALATHSSSNSRFSDPNSTHPNHKSSTLSHHADEHENSHHHNSTHTHISTDHASHSHPTLIAARSPPADPLNALDVLTAAEATFSQAPKPKSVNANTIGHPAHPTGRPAPPKPKPAPPKPKTTPKPKDESNCDNLPWYAKGCYTVY